MSDSLDGYEDGEIVDAAWDEIDNLHEKLNALAHAAGVDQVELLDWIKKAARDHAAMEKLRATQIQVFRCSFGGGWEFHFGDGDPADAIMGNDDGQVQGEGNTERVSDRYRIMRDFSDGFTATLLLRSDNGSDSEHWQAGYKAGYSMRTERSRLLDEYLVSLGQSPQAVIKLV